MGDEPKSETLESGLEARKEMKTNEELLFVVKNAQASLPEGMNHRINDILAFVEGMAPFLEKDTVVTMKCRTCDHYSSCFFPLENDFGVVDRHAYCHQKKMPIHHLTLLAVAKCLNHSMEGQTEAQNLAISLAEIDLKPALKDRKHYDRQTFANFPVELDLRKEGERLVLQVGHRAGDEFVNGDIRMTVLRRSDPSFGSSTPRVDPPGLALAVEGPKTSLRQLGLEDVLEKSARERGFALNYIES
ncbi:MAG: hypothetical protein A4E45_01643 [Methanosaeta sp. PtaB.Bin039]|nr:MAG: hypothetical protein A4E45_01643 [Methanosaeta sp. PtaB.Bin039]OPY46330.1 MAG: hypothetical protein A4E47_00628 [Methanosaeta sp. PtaU1.Bin028]HOT07576.1 hypothetical protein [Methanotrichaceae archaeon]HQF17479.1 hypothetical protein [Methanotrichaceae archaeon]HQI92005.1 hypothetical protein [Methanotrichaceae archaeon]